MKQVNGITLLELLFTITIVSILAVVSAPPLIQWVNHSKMTTLQYNLLHSIHFSRTQAVSLQSTVTLCPGVDNCEAIWSENLLIFNDVNNNGERDNSESRLKAINLGSAGQYLQWRSFRRKQFIQFNAQGLTRALNGTFHYCPTGTNFPYNFSITVAKTGRTRIKNRVNCT